MKSKNYILPNNKPIILAPLAGVSDSAFRVMCQRGGADLTYVEMLSSRAILYKNEKTLGMLKRDPEEKNLGVQITGRDSDEICEAAYKLNDYNFETLDINMGCPVKKVVKVGSGSALLKNPEEVYQRIKAENNRIGEARAINSDLPFFKDQFIMPVEGIISGVYGSQRILNGKPRWPHYGIDIAAKQGTKIKSSGTGVVTMAEDDLYYTGGTVIMDHGHGISTIYSHLETVIVSVGDKINQGDIIGTVGSTGRSTGPHLDFRVNWFQTRLDPMSVLPDL